MTAWDEPGSDPLADIREWKRKASERALDLGFDPVLSENDIMTLNWLLERQRGAP